MSDREPTTAPPHFFRPVAVPKQTGLGICLIDKSSGISSHGVVNALRRRFGVKRIGHTGTLDPVASGLMICLVGREFTKLQDSFLKLPKTYHCTLQLGKTSDTFDRTGIVVTTSPWSELETLTETNFAAALASFAGQQQQQVPIFSAVKIAGRKLYDRARSGEDTSGVELPTRNVTLSNLSVKSWQRDEQTKTLSVGIEVTCSSGTYIRSLVQDLGQKLGVGALVAALRRVRIADWSVTEAQEITAPEIKLYQTAAELPITKVT